MRDLPARRRSAALLRRLPASRCGRPTRCRQPRRRRRPTPWSPWRPRRSSRPGPPPSPRRSRRRPVPLGRHRGVDPAAGHVRDPGQRAAAGAAPPPGAARGRRSGRLRRRRRPGRPSLSRSLEETLSTRLPVWIAALAIALGAAYGVKYSFDQGWIGPACGWRSASWSASRCWSAANSCARAATTWPKACRRPASPRFSSASSRPPTSTS